MEKPESMIDAFYRAMLKVTVKVLGEASDLVDAMEPFEEPVGEDLAKIFTMFTALSITTLPELTETPVLRYRTVRTALFYAYELGRRRGSLIAKNDKEVHA